MPEVVGGWMGGFRKGESGLKLHKVSYCAMLMVSRVTASLAE